MSHSAIQTLEAASQIFLAPPNLVTAEQRREAEAIILDFRKLKTPYQICKEILETSSSEYVIFESVNLLKNALVKEWGDLSTNDILSLRHYLMQYILQRQTPAYVREKIIQLMAIMVKRLGVEDAGQEKKRYIEEARTLITQGPQPLLGCALLQALLQEHCITVKSSDTGLPWSQHFKLKKQFEATELRTIFAFIMKALEELDQSGGGMAQPQVLVEKLLLIAEAALCWGHVPPLIPRRLVGVFETMHQSSPPSLRRSAIWRPILTDEKLPVIFASIAKKGGPLLRPAMSCLGQLASLSGTALPENMRGEHALRIARSLIPLLTEVPEPPSALASALRLLVVHNRDELLALPSHDLEVLLHVVANYMVRLINLAAYEETVGDPENAETNRDLEATLETWVVLLHAAMPPSSDACVVHGPLQQGSTHLFQQILRVRLAPPDGSRASGAEEEAEIEEEGTDLEKYDSILQLVGAMGRACPANTIPLLAGILESKAVRMRELLQAGQEGTELTNIYEDLHWTLLFAGHVLTMDGDGETPTPPGELVRYASETGGDVQASIRLIECMGNVPDPADLQQAQQIIRLVSGVWRVCWWCGWGQMRWLGSPTLAADCAWLLRRWARAYPLSQLLSENTARTMGIRLAGGAAALLSSLPGEPQVTKWTIDLLVTVATNKYKDIDVTNCAELWQAVRWGLGEGGAAFSSDARRGLAKVASLASSQLPPGPERTTRLAALCWTRETLEHLLHEALAKPAKFPSLLHALDVYSGLADGVQSGTAPSVWECVRPALEICSVLAGSAAARCGGGVLAALRTTAACASHLPALLSSSQQGAELLAALAAPLDHHSALPQPQPTLNGDSSAEDEFCEEMLLVMEIGSGILSAGWLYKGTIEAAGTEAALRVARAVLPRMAPPSPLLSRPNLAHQFYRLLQDLGARVVCMLEDEYYHAAISSIAEGFESGPAGCGVGPICELLAEMAALSTELAGQDVRLLHSLQPLTERLVSLSINGAMPDIPRAVPSALYALLTALPQLRVHLPPSLSQFAFDGQRQDSIKFRDNFDRFVTEMQNSA